MANVMDPTTMQLVYTIAEAAEELRIGNSTVRERIRMGHLRSFKDGSRRLIARDDLIDYIERLRKQSPNF